MITWHVMTVCSHHVKYPTVTWRLKWKIKDNKIQRPWQKPGRRRTSPSLFITWPKLGIREWTPLQPLSSTGKWSAGNDASLLSYVFPTHHALLETKYGGPMPWSKPLWTLCYDSPLGPTDYAIRRARSIWQRRHLSIGTHAHDVRRRRARELWARAR